MHWDVKLIFSKLSLNDTFTRLVGETDQFKICAKSSCTLNWISTVICEQLIEYGPSSESDPLYLESWLFGNSDLTFIGHQIRPIQKYFYVSPGFFQPFMKKIPHKVSKGYVNARVYCCF